MSISPRELTGKRFGAGSPPLAADLNKDGAVDIVTGNMSGILIFRGKRNLQPTEP